MMLSLAESGPSSGILLLPKPKGVFEAGSATTALIAWYCMAMAVSVSKAVGLPVKAPLEL